MSRPLRFGSRALTAGVSGLIAIAAGGALAVAPVAVSKTMVEWPAAQSSPSSTVLLLANQTPYSLHVDFDTRAIESAQGNVVFATMDPNRTDARSLGLVISAAAGGSGITLSTGGRTETVPGDNARTWHLTTDMSGLTLSADGAERLKWTDIPPPQIDALVTETSSLLASDLSASVQVVDDPSSQPTTLKIALMLLVWGALAFALLALRRDDRKSHPREGHPTTVSRLGFSSFRWIDIVVVGAMTAWTFIGPMTDDDGYYAHMSANADAAGYVGNYYQLFNQPFTPFTWFWQFLGLWQQIGGSSPVWLRLPALAACVATWFLSRRLLERILQDRPARTLVFARLLLAALTIAWWSAYAIGSRPEGVGALALIVALTLILRALDLSRLLPAAFAAMAAGLAFAAHPTGAVAFAPLLLAIPSLWKIARREAATLPVTLARTIAVLSAGSVALVAAFAGSSLHDMQLNRARFSAVEQPLGWTDEWRRYAFLLADDPMGSYAKRAVVLVALVTVAWFLLVWVASVANRRLAIPIGFTYVGWSAALGFLALWITTSKWTHHFGALASIGPLMIVAVLFVAPRVARQLFTDRPVPLLLPVLATASFVPAIVVALRGPNWWAYAWNQHFYRPAVPPSVGPVALASLAIWVPALVIALSVGLYVARRRRDRASALYSPVVLLGTFVVISTSFLYGTFGYAAFRGAQDYSPGAANISDPSGTACLSENAVTLWDGTGGSPLLETTATTTVDSSDLVRSSARPDTSLIDNGAFVLDRSLSDTPVPNGLGDYMATSASEASAGAVATGWSLLPSTLRGSQRVTVDVAGYVGPGASNGVLVQLGRIVDGTATITRETWITDTAERPGWRSLDTGISPDDLGPDAAVRLIGVDANATPGAWLAFSGARLVNPQSMKATLDESPSLVAWQSSFWFACAVPARIENGIIEPPAYTTTFGTGGPDNIWVVQRGGVLAGASRVAAISTPSSEMREIGSSWGRVQHFEYLYPIGGYDVKRTPIIAWGFASPFGPPSQLVDWAATR